MDLINYALISANFQGIKYSLSVPNTENMIHLCSVVCTTLNKGL